MAGRNAKPISLHLAGGNQGHLTKFEIEQRQKSEIKTGTNKLRCPEFVKNDVIAYAKWKEIMRVYKDIDFVSSGDVGLLARYCVSFSEYRNLLEIKKNINSIDSFSPEEMDEADASMDEQGMSDKQKRNLFMKMEYLISVDGLLTFETAVNKKMDMLIKMEDRLFLNPLAKVKNIPKKIDDEPKENKFSKFKKDTG